MSESVNYGTPIRQSFHRHVHVLGAERELVLLSGLVSILVGMGGLTIIAGICAVAFWLMALFFLRRIAKADPIMSKVWMRHIKHQDYYAPVRSIWRRQ